MTDIHLANKQRLGTFRDALYNLNPDTLKQQLQDLFTDDCHIQLAFPFAPLIGSDTLVDEVYRPLIEAVPDLERRDFILMGGSSHSDTSAGEAWVGCAGHYVGVFERPWLDIPPSQHMIAMRYHEFFRFEEGRVTEMQALWDIPQVMMQTDAWPLAPSLGVEWVVPGPATSDGILLDVTDPVRSQTSLARVDGMLKDLLRSPEGTKAMRLEHHWHPHMIWYGPAGIGTMRRVSGFRHWHQIPFLNAFPDRGMADAKQVFFSDGDYVGFTAFPGMKMTLSGDGWLGIPPMNKTVTGRSLDFWRCENDKLRENWVLLDILDIYHQLGVDVFARMRELTPHRRTFTLNM
jgi:predicted ester cyclase